jgi:hypothetical protein
MNSKAGARKRETSTLPKSSRSQWAVATIIDVANKHGKGEQMAFVHETNAYKGEALRAFEFINESGNPRGIKMTIAFGGKDDYPPLQAADVLAYEGGKFLRNPASGKPRRAWVALDPDKTRISAKRYGKDNMPQLIELLTGFREKLLASGWNGKAAV